MKVKKKLVVLLIITVLLFSISMPTYAAPEHWNDNSANKNVSREWADWKSKWKSVRNNHELVALTPGATEKELNYAWYSKSANQAKIRISKSKDMKNPVVFLGTSLKYKKIDGLTYYANKVTVKKLSSNTTYFYQYYMDGKWSKATKYINRDSKEFSLLYVGDAQIGASAGQTASDSGNIQTAEIAARNDAFSWNTTLETAIEANPDLSFIISAGDQINEKVLDGSSQKDFEQEIEYSGFLSSKILNSIPIATTIGNHDFNTANYKYHFNNPNSFIQETTPTKAGNGYYFTYGNALFITLNTNNHNCKDHEALLKKATEANPEVTWRIVTIHQDIYGSGAGHSNSDGMILRKPLTRLMDKYDIDVVFQGHDHSYSRSYQLSGNNTEDGYKIVSNMKNVVSNKVTNPKGVLYMVENSSTGSKFYKLISTKQNYIASRSQTWTPTYSVVHITEDSFTINTFNVSTGKKIDKPYTIIKTKTVPVKK